MRSAKDTARYRRFTAIIEGARAQRRADVMLRSSQRCGALDR